MMIATWLAALFATALWSLSCWGVHALLTIDSTRVQELKPLIERIPYGETLELWLPGWQTLLQFAIDLTQGLLAGVASAAPWLVWVVWGAGMAVIVLIAGLASLLIVLVRKESKASQQRPAIESAPR